MVGAPTATRRRTGRGVRIVGSLAVLAILVMPGCLDAIPTDAVDNAPGDSAGGPCTLTYPDGSPVDCEATAFAGALTSTTAPAITEGWTCRGSYNKEGRLTNYITDMAGATGVYFDWNPFMDELDFVDGGVGVTSVTAFTTSGGQVRSAVFDREDPRGFVQLDSPIGATGVNLLHYMRVLQLNMKSDAGWAPVDGAELLVSDHEGTPWFVWRWTPPGASAPRFIDVMKADTPDPDEPGPSHAPHDSLVVEVDGILLEASAWRYGVISRDYGSAKRPPPECNGLPI